jgi:hypothetical protein
MKTKAHGGGWVRWLLLVGGCLILGGLIWVYPLVKDALLCEAVPTPNQTYDRLLATAKRSLRSSGAWHLQGPNTDLEVVGVRASEAFGPIAVDGMEVQLLERVYLPVLTDRSEALYDVNVTGITSRNTQPRLQRPVGRSLESSFVEDGMHYWVAKGSRSISVYDSNQPPVLHWRSAVILAGVSGDRRPPSFDPVPTYQIDVFSHGAWSGCFAAWHDGSVSSVRWFSTDQNGNSPGSPRHMDTDKLDL